MIICPNCHHEELMGALFCSECGAKLVEAQTPTTHHIERNPTGMLGFQPASAVPATQVITGGLAESNIQLHLIESGQVLNLTGQTEYSIGRVSEGQPILPDVDLSPFEAYTQGVSRLHASLKVNNNRLFITDLGSSNGTRVNGQKIVPNVDFPVNHGDVVAFGKFKIQILVRK